MPRIARIVEIGDLHYVTQRGDYRQEKEGCQEVIISTLACADGIAEVTT